MKKRIIFALIVVSVLFYIFCFNYTEPTDLGIARDIITGDMWIQKDGGCYFTAPWVRVATIDTRPMRVGVPSTGHGYSAKLVQFDSTKWLKFVDIEGFRYYWWANRFSINFGYSDEYRGMRDIMRGYAYSNTRYPFIKILAEYSN